MGMRLIKAASMGMAVLGAVGSTVAVAQTVAHPGVRSRRGRVASPRRSEARPRENRRWLHRSGRRLLGLRRLGAPLRRRARRQRRGRSKDGTVCPKPFLDLTDHNPLGTEVQTGFVEQGLWSMAFDPKFKENGYLFVHYSSLPFNGARMVTRYTVAGKPGRDDVDQAKKSVKVLTIIPQPYYNHYGGGIAFGPDGYPLHRQGRRRLGRRSARCRSAPGRAVGQDAAHRRRYA